MLVKLNQGERLDPQVDKSLVEQGGGWMSETRRQTIMKSSAEVASFFMGHPEGSRGCQSSRKGGIVVMKNVLLAGMLLVSIPVLAAEPKTAPAPAKTLRVHQTDAYGRIQYSQPSLVVQPGGRILQVDPYGNTQYQKPGFQVKGDKVYQTDPQGRIQYNKPGLVIKK